MKRNLRFLYVAFCISLTITFIVGYLFSVQLELFIKYNNKVEKTQEVLERVTRVQYYLVEAESEERGFLLSPDSSFLKRLHEIQEKIYGEIDSLKNVLDTNLTQHANLINLSYAVSQRMKALNETVEHRVSGKQAAFMQSVIEGKNQMINYRNFATRIENEEMTQLSDSEKSRKQYQVAAPKYLIAILVVSLVFQMISFFLMVKEIRRRYAYQQRLEININQLNHSHAELEQIAFVASHDLQEPLRKVRTFSERLSLKYKDALTGEGLSILERIDYSAERMQGLIEDLVDYTSVVNSKETPQQVDLKKCIETVKGLLQNDIERKQAVLNIKLLPIIKGYPQQFELLFRNLISNAIKFSRDGVAPVINITSSIVEHRDIITSIKPVDEKLLQVTISDNGIGFEQEFREKIFDIFQRLHLQTSVYEGKGIGLAICKRIMINHEGFITAEGKPGDGASFKLYFPASVVQAV